MNGEITTPPHNAREPARDYAGSFLEEQGIILGGAGYWVRVGRNAEGRWTFTDSAGDTLLFDSEAEARAGAKELAEGDGIILEA